MRFIKRLLPLLLPLWLTGCVSEFTNVTPPNMARNDTGLYPVEVVWECNLKALKKDSIQARVEVGDQKFKMDRTPLVPDRWQTLISLPPGTNLVNYRVRMDFEYYDIPVVRSNSSLSPFYSLKIQEK